MSVLLIDITKLTHVNGDCHVRLEVLFLYLLAHDNEALQRFRCWL